MTNDQPGPHGRRGKGGTADVRETAILSLEPSDLRGTSPVTRAFQSTALRVEENTTWRPPAAGKALDVCRGDAGLLVGGRPVDSSFPTICARTALDQWTPPGPTKLEQLVARHAPTEVVAGAR